MLIIKILIKNDACDYLLDNYSLCAILLIYPSTL